MPIANTSSYHTAPRSQEKGQAGIDTIPELTESYTFTFEDQDDSFGSLSRHLHLGFILAP